MSSFILEYLSEYLNDKGKQKLWRWTGIFCICRDLASGLAGARDRRRWLRWQRGAVPRPRWSSTRRPELGRRRFFDTRRFDSNRRRLSTFSPRLNWSRSTRSLSAASYRGRFVKREQWKRWRANGELGSGSKHKGVFLQRSGDITPEKCWYCICEILKSGFIFGRKVVRNAVLKCFNNGTAFFLEMTLGHLYCPRNLHKTEINLKQNWNKTVSKLFCFSQNNAWPWNVLAVLANYCRYTLFERQSRGGAARWRI